uniref:Uncharacterized protein n=1 Tax=Panagrolaimus sp. PS1159 TaxID=55785 RepID=A0AC35GQG8_9BILA
MRPGGFVNTYTAGVITELLKDGQVSNLVKEIRVENKAKMEALLMILTDELPKECQTLHKPTVRKILDGQSFWSGDSNGDSQKALANGIRLAVAYPLLDEIIKALHIFCSTIKELLHSK